MLLKVKSDEGRKWSSFPDGACSSSDNLSQTPQLCQQLQTWVAKHTEQS